MYYPIVVFLSCSTEFITSSIRIITETTHTQKMSTYYIFQAEKKIHSRFVYQDAKRRKTRLIFRNLVQLFDVYVVIEA